MYACHCVISRFCEEIRRICPVISALFSSGEAVDDLNPGADLFTFSRRAGYQSRFRTISRHEGLLSLRRSPVFGPARECGLRADLNVEEGFEVDSSVVCTGISSESL